MKKRFTEEQIIKILREGERPACATEACRYGVAMAWSFPAIRTRTLCLIRPSKGAFPCGMDDGDIYSRSNPDAFLLNRVGL